MASLPPPYLIPRNLPEFAIDFLPMYSFLASLLGGLISGITVAAATQFMVFRSETRHRLAIWRMEAYQGILLLIEKYENYFHLHLHTHTDDAFRQAEQLKTEADSLARRLKLLHCDFVEDAFWNYANAVAGYIESPGEFGSSSEIEAAKDELVTALSASSGR